MAAPRWSLRHALPVLLLRHGNVLDDDKLFVAALAGCTTRINRGESSGLRNLGFLFAIRADQHITKVSTRKIILRRAHDTLRYLRNTSISAALVLA
jgi:hypothetical protein